jgi:hypothetical protein
MIYVSFNRENEHGRQPSPKGENKSMIPYVRQPSPKSESKSKISYVRRNLTFTLAFG